MNIKALALASLIGLSAPAITAVGFTTNTASAMPTDFVRPKGTFADVNQEWEVRLYLDQFGVYSYQAINTKNGSSLTLKNPEVSQEEQAYKYTFKNGNYRYQVIYNPSRPKSIFLYVFNPNGNLILSRNMVKGYARPQGTFVDANQEWVVRLYMNQSGNYIYEGENTKTRSKLTLKNPKTSLEEQAYIYTFTNAQYRYQVIYNPANEKAIALYVFDPNSKVILTRNMTLDYDV
ncbi:MAG: hypothetical protein QNJ51_29885 [Calothrix sp. MO_167.B12]|nr:hypothetical protein [Calothrix sp. MO_167.B12]